MYERKQVYYKIYDSTGVFVATLNGYDFVNPPEFSIEINGGLSGLELIGTFTLTDMNVDGSGIITAGNESIKTKPGITRLFNGLFWGNRVDVYIKDVDTGTDELQIYSGIITELEVLYDNQNKETIKIRIMPNHWQMSARILKSGSNTTVSYNSQDPSYMVKDIVEKANTAIEYTGDTVNMSGVSRTYEFVSYTCLEAIGKAVDLMPARWIFFIAGNNHVYVRNIDKHGALHRIFEKGSTLVYYLKSITDLKNRLYFLGGGSPQMFKKYDKAGSQNAFGLFEEKIADERVTDATTAQSISDKILNYKQSPQTKLTIEIKDNNFNAQGYDIESIQPGDRIIVDSEWFDWSHTLWKDFKWGEDSWKYSVYALTGIPAIVRRINYKFDSIVCECEFEFIDSSKRIEDINRDLTNYRFKDAPDAPS